MSDNHFMYCKHVDPEISDDDLDQLLKSKKALISRCQVSDLLLIACPDCMEQAKKLGGVHECVYN